MKRKPFSDAEHGRSDRVDRLFLDALGASLRGERVQWEEPLGMQDWTALLRLAQEQRVLPMICEAVSACPAARDADAQLMQIFRRQALKLTMMQAIKTREFLELMKHLRAAGVTPCVVKGLICRSLYPYPDQRSSGDEDLLIPPEQFERCHEAMLAFGMRRTNPRQNLHTAYEVSYDKPGSMLYVELHRHLFPPESDVFGGFNRFFADAHAQTMEITVDGVPLTTLGPTQHFFYLIGHAFKHFLHCGFGVRQVCDIALFAGCYGREIDWMAVLDHCRALRAERFAAALLRIGQMYLGLDPDAAGIPPAWSAIAADEGPMLSDLLDSGVHGGVSMSRKYSSTLTINAVAADWQGKADGHGLLRTLFPDRQTMEIRDPYLLEKPWLLPWAWLGRIAHYAVHRHDSGTDSRAAESLRIGRRRVELLRRYGIIG